MVSLYHVYLYIYLIFIFCSICKLVMCLFMTIYLSLFFLLYYHPIYYLYIDVYKHIQLFIYPSIHASISVCCLSIYTYIYSYFCLCMQIYLLYTDLTFAPFTFISSVYISISLSKHVNICQSICIPASVKLSGSCLIIYLCLYTYLISL